MIIERREVGGGDVIVVRKLQERGQIEGVREGFVRGEKRTMEEEVEG